jgi:RNA polymerase sigma-70 factor (ECF subfamily)
MSRAPTTRPSLLVRIRDVRDGDAWAQFVEIYGPLVYEYGRRHGLQDSDAADLTQDVLRAVVGAAERFRYDPRRGAFRSWLFTVARTKRLDMVAGQPRHLHASGDTALSEQLESLPARDDDCDQSDWDEAYARRRFAWAAEQVRGEFKESTWQAFWRTSVDGENAQDAAKALDMTVGAIYVAKSRVLARLRRKIEETRCDDEPFEGPRGG